MTYQKINLNDIDGSNNIRRASPYLSNKGVNVLELCKAQGLGISKKWWVPFLQTTCEDSKLLSLARSLAITGQIHPIVVVKNGSSYCCISGQRRYIAMVMLECLRNVVRFCTSDEIAICSALMNPSDLPPIDLKFFEDHEDDILIAAEIKEGLIGDQADKLAFTANEEAEPMTDIDWALWIDKMLKQKNVKTEAFYTFDEMSKISGKSVWWLKQRVHLLLLPKEWQEKLDTKEITIAKATAYALELFEGKAPEPVAAIAKTTPTPEEKAVPVVPSSVFEAIYETSPKVARPSAPPMVAPSGPTASDEDDDMDGEPEEVTAIDMDDIEERDLSPDGPVATKKVKDWTEGTRKKRTTKPKMMKYDEVINLLRSLEKTDIRAIEILGMVLKFDLEQAQELAGSSAEKI